MPEQEPVEVQVQTTVIVVSHNRCDQLRRCLEALEHSEEKEKIEVLVVDNGSRDGSAQLDTEFPNTRFIRLPRNFGLTKALNIGVRAARGEFVFFLHDDTEPSPDAVARLAHLLDSRPEAAAVCPLLITPEGEPGPQVRNLPRPENADQPWSAARPGSEPEPLVYSSGAALMVRKYFIQAMRNIDERYGQYFWDAEVAHQIGHAGKQILLDPGARVLHHGCGEPHDEREAADRALGAARYVGKHFGFLNGIKARIGAVFSALFRLRVSRVADLVTGQKIDGSQPGA